MATMKMSGCLALVAKMPQSDQDALLARLDQYQADGIPAERAQVMAANDMLAEIRAEREQLMSAIAEQHPDLLTVTRDQGFADDPSAADEALSFSRRRDAPVTLPDALILAPLGAATASEDYKAAKGGDPQAATRIADVLVDDAAIAKIRQTLGNRRPTILPVAAQEASGRNGIPMAAAIKISAALGLRVADEVVQSVRVGRTAMDGLGRIFAQPEFDGRIEPGVEYLIIDDTLTQGATFAALASHIESSGGRVILPVALTGKQYSATLRPTPETLSALRQKFGDIEDDFRRATGYGFDALTQSEARYLASYRPADAVRDRIASAIQQRSRPGDARPTGEKGLTASRQRTPLGFYSALAEGIDGIKTNAAPAAGWRDAIKGLINKGQVKADEVEWTGVNDWLDLQQGRVTKAQVEEYLKQGGVRVEETVLGEVTAVATTLNRELQGTGYSVEADNIYDELVFIDPDDDLVEYSDLPPEAQEIVDRVLGGESDKPAKYAQYTLPGGKNYREVLLTLPPAGEKTYTFVVKQGGGRAFRFNGVEYATEQEARAAEVAARKSEFKSNHWDQPNVLAHLRVNDREDADGNRVLFVEEIQSDWGQEGKKKGFASKAVSAEKAGPVKTIPGNGLRDREEQPWRVTMQDGSVEERALPVGVDPMRGAADKDGPPIAPFVTKTEGWLNLALKRAITMAVEGGYDKIAFANGQQNADRYDLSKQISRVEFIDNVSGGAGLPNMDGPVGAGMLRAYDMSGSRVMNQRVGGPADVENYVGKEVAQRLLESKPTASSDAGIGVRRRSLSGLDLKVGGEGMKAFYDNIVPNAVRALAKKLGGRVEMVGILRPVGVDLDPSWGTHLFDPDKWEMNNEGEVVGSQPGLVITDEMRAKVGEGLPLFSRRRLFLERDEVGRPQLVVGAAAYNLAATVANNVLDKVSMKPISKDLGRAMRKMKLEIERAQNRAVDVASRLKDLPEDERQMISDVIEGELKAGVTPPRRVLELAASMQSIMSEQAAELVRLGMLSPEAAGRWDGKYLPRFYESKLGDETRQWMRAATALFRKQKTLQGIKGDSLKSRGLFQTVPVDELDQWTDNGWEVRDEGYRPGRDQTVQVWRDFTREERERMGEIRDAMFRFVMGYTKSQRDVALGRLYENLAADVASRTALDGFVKVPDTKVEDTQARRYGALAGMYVPREVLDHLSAFDETMYNDLLRIYRKGLSMWKEGKTVLNPVAHANNVISNLTMAHFAGVSYWDIGKYAGTVRDLVKGSPVVDEARDAGLFGATFNRAELLDSMPEQLKALAQMSDSRLARGVDTVWSAMSFWLRKPLGKAYEAEDLFFRFLIYRDARKRGLDADDAVDFAQQYIFAYDDLPKGARVVRDLGLPFFGYTYKAVPALASTAMKYPWRFAAPAAVLYGLNAAMYAMAFGAAQGGDDDDWMEVLRRYVTDDDYRKKVAEFEASERENLPPWMKGTTALQTPKAIRLGMDAATNLPLFLDVSRMVPGGDLFDAENNAGGAPILQPIMPSNPVLTTLFAMLGNRDMFTGKDVVNKLTDTSEEAAAKRATWLWKQASPAIAVGNTHWDRALNAVANLSGEPILGYTGVGRDGLPVQAGYAIAQTAGVKVRPIDLETSERITESQRQRVLRELEIEIKRINRLESRGAITAEAAARERERQQEKKDRVRQRLTVDGDPAR